MRQKQSFTFIFVIFAVVLMLIHTMATPEEDGSDVVLSGHCIINNKQLVVSSTQSLVIADNAIIELQNASVICHGNARIGSNVTFTAPKREGGTKGIWFMGLVSIRFDKCTFRDIYMNSRKVDYDYMSGNSHYVSPNTLKYQTNEAFIAGWDISFSKCTVDAFENEKGAFACAYGRAILSRCEVLNSRIGLLISGSALIVELSNIHDVMACLLFGSSGYAQITENKIERIQIYKVMGSTGILYAFGHSIMSCNSIEIKTEETCRIHIIECRSMIMCNNNVIMNQGEAQYVLSICRPSIIEGNNIDCGDKEYVMEVIDVGKAQLFNHSINNNITKGEMKIIEI